MIISLSCFILIKQIISPIQEKKLNTTFAAISISTYYWFRIPALFGFSKFISERPLINLSGTIDQVWLTCIVLLLIFFCYYQLVVRKRRKKSWSLRPVFEKLSKTK
jgi:hypothetical protein